MHSITKLAALVAAAALTAACGDDASTTAPKLAGAGPDDVGAVFTQTNAAAGNEILVLARAADGSLSAPVAVATGGQGTGAGLGSQGAVALSDDGRFLFAVNAGSNSVSSFRVRPSGGVELVSTVPSGGIRPTSLDADKGLLYVLNADAPANITGFTIASDGTLAPLAGSTRALSAAAPAPAQVGFTPDGRVLLVSERATNRLVTYVVGRDGRPSAPIVHASAGTTPFGFEFDRQRGVVIVSEAAGGAADASTASSYRVGANGSLAVVTAAAATTETAACWVVVTGDGKYAYTSNAGSASLSGFAVGTDGALSLLDADGRTGLTGAGPIDAAVSRNSRFLYVVNGRDRSVSAFAIAADGMLESRGIVTGLPSAAGLAAY